MVAMTVLWWVDDWTPSIGVVGIDVGAVEGDSCWCEADVDGVGDGVGGGVDD